jgi:hypothetical protein
MKDMHSLDLGATAVTDAGLAHLGHMSKLHQLHLSRSAVTDAGMEHVSRLSNISSLRLSDTSISDAGLVHLAKLPKLQDLQVLNTRVTQKGIDALKRALPNVTVRQDNSVATKDAAATIESLAIQRLRQIGVTITEKNGVATGFRIGNSPTITDTDLTVLQSLGSLENFTLVGCVHVTDAGFAHLKHLPRLQKLNLSPSNITDAGLANVKGMKDLWFLSLNSTRITDAGMLHLTELSSLKQLILSNTQVTAAGLIHLASLKNLKSLQLINAQITPTAVEELRKQLPKDCEIKHSFAPPQQTTTATADDYRLTVDAKKHVADVKLLTHTSVITIPANREYTISCAGKARNNNNGGDDLFHGVVLYYQDKNDSDGNNSVYTVLRPGETLKTGEIYWGPPGKALESRNTFGEFGSGFGKALKTGAIDGSRNEVSELRAFFVTSNVASKNSGRYTLKISGANEHTLVIDSKKHVQRIDKDFNAACLEIPSGSQYKVSCSGSARNNTNGGDDLFNGVLVYYQDTMDSDGNRSVYRVLREGDSFVTDTIYGEGIGKLRACFLASNNVASNNRGSYTIRVQRIVKQELEQPK